MMLKYAILHEKQKMKMVLKHLYYDLFYFYTFILPTNRAKFMSKNNFVFQVIKFMPPNLSH